MKTQELFMGNNEQKRNLETIKLYEQIESQIKILSKLGIFEIFPDSKKQGIYGIDGKKYPMPMPKEVMKRLENNKELVLKKMEQGFTKLIIEPFALPLDILTMKYREVILQHFKNHKLYATKENQTDSDETIALDINQPIWSSGNEYSKNEKKEELVYFPIEFSKTHGGKTKKEILSNNSKDAWCIWLIEDMPNIPRIGKGKVIGKRHQLESQNSPNEYLKLTQTKSEYKNEEGLTPEADIIYAITLLEETNQVINDFQGKGTISYQLGGYFPISNKLPVSYWSREDRQAILFNSDPMFCSPLYGTRTGVRL